MMSDSRRRSTRRGKKRSIYSLNDLVQIPHNSTNLVGRLACKIMEQPSVRWLVAFDDIPSRKDEEMGEEALGPIIGKDTTNGNGSGKGKEKSLSTRSVRRKGNSSTGNNAEDSSVIKINGVIKKKDDANTDAGQMSERGDGTGTNTNAVEKKKSSDSIPKETIQKSEILSKPIRTPSPKLKVKNDRDQRSRRRRALPHDEANPILPKAAVADTDSNTRPGKKPAPSSGSFSEPISLKNKRSIPTEGITNNNDNGGGSNSKNDNKAKGEYSFRNKKAKVNNNVPKPRSQAKKEVLKVQLLTGTLYLSKEKVVWTFTR